MYGGRTGLRHAGTVQGLDGAQSAPDLPRLARSFLDSNLSVIAAQVRRVLPKGKFAVMLGEGEPVSRYAESRLGVGLETRRDWVKRLGVGLEMRRGLEMCCWQPVPL